MVQYETMILKFGKMGEKTGWTYIDVPQDVADRLNKGVRTSYRVKGRLDEHKIAGMALIPMGEGAFILPLKAEIRKMIGKKEGARLKVQLDLDTEPFKMNQDLIDCLADDPEALAFFKTLTGGHQRYFSKWIDSAKTEETKARRIAKAVNALSRKWGYPEMLRADKKTY